MSGMRLSAKREGGAVAADARTRRESVLLALLVASIASTAIHYTDNAVSLADYPAPDSVSLSPGAIVLAWVLLTPVGILGYRLYRGRRWALAYVCLWTYAYTGLSTPAHYLYGSPAELPLLRNVSILSDGVIGGAILLFVLWSALVAREWRARVPA
jgi:hypothetical protein